MNRFRHILPLLAIVLTGAGICACSDDVKDPTPPIETVSSLTLSSTDIVFKKAGSTETLSFHCNSSWKVETPSWIHANPSEGKATDGSLQTFSVQLTADKLESSGRQAEIKIIYGGDKSKSVKASQESLPLSSQFEITDDMVFSTTLGANSTNIAQGFDYDPVEDVIYITQKSNVFRNHVGWQKRYTDNRTTTAADKMLLVFFAHGNNISIERADDGKKYVWAPNYGTRQDDGSYNQPKIVSRIPLEKGKTVYNTDTTDNYYFGTNVTWPAFDFKNDMMAMTSGSTFKVYRLSELMALPVEEITLDYSITYGGSSPKQTNVPEFSGKPVVAVHDCRKVQPIYTIPFTYKERGLKWQTFCIDDGWIFALHQTPTKKAPDIMFDTYVEAYKIDGTKEIHMIRQEYMQNRDRILEFGWTEKDYFYCEPEGIKVYDGIMLIMYGIRGADTIRRPVIFRVASPVSETD